MSKEQFYATYNPLYAVCCVMPGSHEEPLYAVRFNLSRDAAERMSQAQTESENNLMKRRKKIKGVLRCIRKQIPYIRNFISSKAMRVDDVEVDELVGYHAAMIERYTDELGVVRALRLDPQVPFNRIRYSVSPMEEVFMLL